MSTLGFTVSDEGTHAYCHHCGLALRRSSDRFGLILAANAHVENSHGNR